MTWRSSIATPAEARALAEQLGFLHISIQEPLGLGFGSTVKLHP